LVGSDNNKNRVLLTAREHYLCHWLLVKRNEVGSVARKKMIKAWFLMAAIGDTNRPTISKNTYAKYKEEFSYAMSESQKGHKNSQYGKRWYTNRNTGECKRFKEKPDETWILGKNWFESQKIYSLKTKKPGYTIKGFEFYKEKIKNNAKVNEVWTKQKWNEFHASSCESIHDFYLKGLCEFSWVVLTNRFKQFIPIYSKIAGQGKTFSPDKTLINVYE
jgi:hypothetical protein